MQTTLVDDELCELILRNVLSKLDCRSRTEATSKAHELGLLAPAVTR
jgi:hypothetical protein